jgi:hypothetical protein
VLGAAFLRPGTLVTRQWPRAVAEARTAGIAVNPIADNRFSARILEHRSLL